MSYEQFVEELNKRYKITSPQQLDGLRLQHYSFAKSTRSRGLEFIESMEKGAGFDFKGAKVLDVGCAYGGFCIEAARKGAIAYGIEISSELLKLAAINAEGEKVDGEIHFVKVDATSNDLVTLLAGNLLDLVVLNDVFEHVYDTPKLLKNMSLVAAPGGLLYFEIPNGLCMRFIAREGHQWVPGISIMDPSYWHCRVGWFDAYYRRWDYYAALLSYYGFSDIRLLNFGKTFDGDRAQLTKHLEVEFEDVRKAVSADLQREDSIAQPYREALLTKMTEVEKEMQGDLNSLSDAELCWKYLTPFWRGIAVKQPDSRAVAERHKLLRVGFPAAEQLIRDSFSYRLGNMLVQAAVKPGRNTFLLPYRLIGLCVTEFKKQKGRMPLKAAGSKLGRQ